MEGLQSLSQELAIAAVALTLVCGGLGLLCVILHQDPLWPFLLGAAVLWALLLAPGAIFTRMIERVCFAPGQVRNG